MAETAGGVAEGEQTPICKTISTGALEDASTTKHASHASIQHRS
jgi:hypothetical protein